MERRRVTILIGRQPCSFYSDDSDAYISALEQRTNAILKQTAAFSGSSAYNHALITVVYLTDQLLRMERKGAKRNPPKGAEKDNGQVSMWDLLDDREKSEEQKVATKGRL